MENNAVIPTNIPRVDRDAVRDKHMLDGILTGRDPETGRRCEMLRPGFGKIYKRIDGKLVQTYPVQKDAECI